MLPVPLDCPLLIVPSVFLWCLWIVYGVPIVAGVSGLSMVFLWCLWIVYCVPIVAGFSGLSMVFLLLPVSLDYPFLITIFVIL